MPNPTYGDRLYAAMRECGQPTSPVVNQEGKAQLRFDAMEIDEEKVTFLWLGKPVYMARRNQDHLIHVRGETALNIN
jgi:hypothetical protein